MSVTRTTTSAAGLALALFVLTPGVALAHDEQHGGSGGHLPAKAENVRLIGSADVTDRTPNMPPPGAGDPSPIAGRVADVNVLGNFAYLAAFRAPTCEDGGVFVIDVTNPRAPVELVDDFIPTSSGSYVGEGVQVLKIGARDVLLFNNEICDTSTTDGDPAGQGGVTIVDVTDPRNSVVLAQNFGDTTGTFTDPAVTTPVHQIHSVFAWQDGGRTFAALVDDDEAADIDIIEITDPAVPRLISETSFRNNAEVRQASNTPNGDTQFFHDLVVKEVDGVQTMIASYWDNGYLLLDVEDPTAPKLLRDSDFAAEEPFTAELGLPRGTVPEGNAHQAEFSPNNRFVIGTDEDFGPFRITAEITSGPNRGQSFTASIGSATPGITPERPLTGTTDFVGRGCVDADPNAAGNQTDPYPAKAGDIAVIERGACTFQEKYDRAVAAGYTGVIVMNAVRPDCRALVNSLVTGTTVPYIFVNRPDGLRILNQTISADPCTQAAPPIGGDTGDIAIRSIFDGWGYVHLFDTATMSDLDQYAIPEALDVRFARGSGDLTVHEVAMDEKNPGRAYLSYYAGGLRVVEYGDNGLREIGAYIEEGGSNLWGVQTWTSPTTGQDYILASDRDAGLRIFQFGATGPDPVIPEAPLALLLPLAAFVVGGAVVARRRRPGAAALS